MKYFPVLEPWLEPQFKMIAQPPPDYDPGDTANREGMFATAAYILHQLGKMDDAEFRFCCDRYDKVISLLNDPNHSGFIRRYPDPTYWGGRSDRLSRDQSVPNVVAMGFVNKPALKRFFLAHLKYRALLFTTNTRSNWAWPPGDPRYDAKEYRWKLPDITILSFHGLYIRAFKAWYLYPLLWLTDIDMLGGALLKVLWYGKNPTKSDDINHLVAQYQSELVMPTLWSKLAKWVYGKYRQYPVNSDGAKNAAQATMNNYFRGDTPGGHTGPKLEIVYEEINSYFFKT